jgi:Fe-Mn family superoxide dismutase
MPFSLAPLPFAEDALEPHMSARTLSFHYGKHHQTYVTNLNGLIKDTDLAALTLDVLVHKTAQDPAKAAVFNNAAQVWNHDFFWHCLKKEGGGKPAGALLDALEKTFGSFDAFKEQFKQAGLGQFGSGWVWLVLDQGELKIVKTANADTPLAHNRVALITCDVWEHAYYLDFQNRRGDFLQTFLDHLVDWEAAEARFTAA